MPQYPPSYDPASSLLSNQPRYIILFIYTVGVSFSRFFFFPSLKWGLAFGLFEVFEATGTFTGNLAAGYGFA
jgi:hypothetical protein